LGIKIKIIWAYFIIKFNWSKSFKNNICNKFKSSKIKRCFYYFLV